MREARVEILVAAAASRKGVSASRMSDLWRSRNAKEENENW